MSAMLDTGMKSQKFLLGGSLLRYGDRMGDALRDMAIALRN